MLNTYTLLEIKYKDLTTLTFENKKIYLLKVEKNNVMYEFLIKINKNSDKLLVMGSGAYDYEKIKPPVFQRLSWINEFDSSVIYYNDPTLYEGNISLGWGYGNEHIYYLEDIKDILSILSEMNSINNENIVFYGSSGGGFMSMILATLTKGSRAIVNNPQTNVLKYHEKHKDKLFDVIYKGKISEEIINKNLHRLSVIETIKKEKYVPKILYLQNLSCDFDMNNQFIPFIQQLKDINEKYYYNNIDVKLYSNIKDGHTPVSKEDTKNIINAVLNTKNYLPEVSEVKDNRVTISVNFNKIIVDIESQNEREEYACYLIYNGQINKKIPYQKNNKFEIEIDKNLKMYEVTIFIKLDKNNIEKIKRKVTL